MDAEKTAAATTRAVVESASGFMRDGATYARGADLGFEGMDFYTVGRGGALGDVEADVVAAAFVFFEPAGLRRSWEAGRKVMPPLHAAAEFAACCHAWAEANVPDEVPVARIAELVGKVNEAASPSGAPLFAGWRQLREPGTPKALAVHRLNCLRELRGALHGAAVLAAGIRPLEAVMVNSPLMVGVFGWPEPHPDPADHEVAVEQAEGATNQAMARVFEVLTDDERGELVDLLQSLHQSLS